MAERENEPLHPLPQKPIQRAHMNRNQYALYELQSLKGSALHEFNGMNLMESYRAHLAPFSYQSF